MASHCLNQFWIIVNLIPWNKIQFNLCLNTTLPCGENAFKVCEFPCSYKMPSYCAVLAGSWWEKQVSKDLNISIYRWVSARHCSTASVLAMEILQSCTKPSILYLWIYFKPLSASCVARPSVTMVLTAQDIWISVIHQEGFELPVPTQFWEMVEYTHKNVS